MHPVELIKLGQLRRRIRRLRLKRRGVVDHQRQILMNGQRLDQLADLLLARKIRLHQLDPDRSQPRQLGSLAAIAARHLPTCRHQLFAQIETKPAATPRHQCTHTLSLIVRPGDTYRSPRHKPLAVAATRRA